MSQNSKNSSTRALKPKAKETSTEFRRQLSISSGRPQKQDNPEQSKAFIEKAREIEADEERSAADKLMERLAKTKPEPRKPTKS
jgi:hypothetical protein